MMQTCRILLAAVCLAGCGAESNTIEDAGRDAQVAETAKDEVRQYLESRPDLHAFTMETAKGMMSGFYKLDSSGRAIFQDDIVLPVNSLRSVVLRNRGMAWPGGVVPYIISPPFFLNDAIFGTTRVADIKNAMQWWTQTSGIQFVERSDQEDWIFFVPADDTSSYVGRQGRCQSITLADWATTGNVAHELGHALGLGHEHSSPVRDLFLGVNWACIDTKDWYNYYMLSTSDYRVPDGYDFDSIMHYPQSACIDPLLASAGLHNFDLITPWNQIISASRLGQRTHVSSLDAAAVRLLHGL